MRVSDFADMLIPPGKAADWDPVGIQVGDPTAQVESVAVCHEVSERVIEKVMVDQPDLLISYHPLLFRAVNSFVSGRSASGRAYRLAREGISLLVVHTAFDVAPGGTADALAEAAGIEDPRPFGRLVAKSGAKVVTFVPENAVADVRAAMSTAGGGRIGDYHSCTFQSEGVGTFLPGEGTDPHLGTIGELNAVDEVRVEMITAADGVDQVVAALVAAHPYEEPAYDVYPVNSNDGFVGRIGELSKGVTPAQLAEVLAETLPARDIKLAGESNQLIATVAVVPGSGSDLVGAAGRSGADALVTGDVGHHRVVEALDRGLAVLDAGHAPTERPGMRRLHAAVAAVGIPTIDLTDLNTDPWGR